MNLNTDPSYSQTPGQKLEDWSPPDGEVVEDSDTLVPIISPEIWEDSDPADRSKSEVLEDSEQVC